MDVDGIQWDAGNWPKCGRHGVSRAEIETVLLTGKVAPSIGRSITEQRFIAVGRTRQGRPLFVAFVLRNTSSGVRIRPFSARYMHEKEARRYDA